MATLMVDLLTQSDKKWNIMLGVVTISVIAAFVANQSMWFIVAIYYDTKDMNPAILAILNQGSGTIGSLTGMVIGFWVGSSKGSQDKDDATKIAAKTAADAVTTAATATAATQATLDKVMSNTGNGNGNGDPHATTLKVTPPPPPDSVKIETKLTNVSHTQRRRGKNAKPKSG